LCESSSNSLLPRWGGPHILMASEEEELAAISDYVVAILKSPTWVSPIAKFVDDNSGIFEDVEENKLEYTIVHNAFKQLVDDLLVAHLVEMSLSTEQFMRFCERGLCGNNELHRSLIEQLISVEDFLVFKAMMVKRNCDLNREVLGPPLTNASNGGSNELATCDPSAESAEEAERLEAERRCVEAEIQLAEALSLQLEKRLQLMEALDEVLELVSKIYKLRADALEQQIAEEKAAEQEMLQQAAADVYVAPPLPVLRAPAMLAPVQHNPHLAPIISTSVSIRPLSEASAIPLPDYANGMSFLGSTGASCPNRLQNTEYKKLDCAIQKQRVEAASAVKRQDAMMAIAASPAPLSYDAQYNAQYGMQQPAAVSAPAAPLQPTDEEKQQRAEHLRRQRALLVEKKNRERENQLTNFQMQNGATNASNVAQRALQQAKPTLEPGQTLAAELSGLVQPAPQLPNPAEAAAVEMRKMLTRQLRASFQ